MLWRIALAIAAAAVISFMAFLFLAWRPAIPPVAQPIAAFSADSIARGEILSAEGHCVSCHTRPGGQLFAGGYAIDTPFGTIFGPNITPDPKTGIGGWSLEAFTRALRQGVARDGSDLFPVFPYYSYTELNDDDIRDLYAYQMTRTPVRATTPVNTVPFPLNIRAFEEGWKILFFRSRRYKPNPSKSAQWNRGAYLAIALADCGGCHTPRDVLGAEITDAVYQGGIIDNWIAPALTESNPSPVVWTQDELFRFLREGVAPLHGAIASRMTPVVRDALGRAVVPDTDVHALATYFSDIDNAASHESDIKPIVSKALATSSLGSINEYDPAACLYAAACMSCHYNAGPQPLARRPELALNSAMTMREPTNFIQVVLTGVNSNEGAPGLVMPAYSSLSDAEIASLGDYLRRTRTNLPRWTDLQEKVARIRRQLPPSHNRE